MDQYEHLIPRYLRVAQSLKTKIVEGTYEPGDRLPPQHTLASDYGGAFSTVQRALDLLQSDGYVVRKVGVGTYASSPEDKSPRALVVDDDQRVREFLAVSLEQVGWNVTAAESGLRAIEEAEATDFDLIFSGPSHAQCERSRCHQTDSYTRGRRPRRDCDSQRRLSSHVVRSMSGGTGQPTPILGGDSE